MTLEIKKQIEDLTDELLFHRYCYYVLAAPHITDAEYDAMERSLRALEDDYPHYRLECSTTITVGSSLPESYPKHIRDRAEKDAA